MDKKQGKNKGKNKGKIKPGVIGRWVFMLVMAAVFVGPLLFTILSSLKNNAEIFGNPFGAPKQLRFSNYYEAWTQANMGSYFINSLLISAATVLGLALVGTMAAFALTRFRFRMSKGLTIFFTVGMMIPLHTVLVPITYAIGIFDLKNNLAFLVLLYVAFSIPFSVLVLANYMSGISRELEEAAFMDGANYLQIYRYVALPMTVPAIATISIFNFLSAWNNMLFPLIFINDRRLKPIALGLLNFTGERGSQFGPLMAAIAITVSVPVILYLLFQEKVESGLSAGAVKG